LNLDKKFIKELLRNLGIYDVKVYAGFHSMVACPSVGINLGYTSSTAKEIGTSNCRTTYL
jgi:hypothetical protein